jgi:hypothetical protein
LSPTNYIGELGFKSFARGHGQGDLLYNKLPRKWNPAGYAIGSKAVHRRIWQLDR